ncbi:MAG: hypothetical protein A3K60_04735 [Euryarchaeota archaeon RBG_19FT_COMBO_56_21]|nr:MAG: hypothetical protein A3K60_04735 [Euryarchaeota archaeon RBG_19FT_COMBO_56_21]
MSHALLQKLVRQSETEGVTLAEIISRTLTAEELDDVQAELADELSEGYGSICDFMSDIEVPSLEDIMDAEETSETGLARALD